MDAPIKEYKTKISKEKGTMPTKRLKPSKSKPDYFPAPRGGGGWPSRHDRTAAPVDATATAEASAATIGRHAKPTIWDLTITPPKWAPAVLPTSKTPPATVAALEVQAAKSLRKLRSELSALCAARGMKARVRKLTFERWRFAAKREEEDAAAMAAPEAVKVGKKRPRAPAVSAPSLHPLLPARAPNAEADLAVELTRQGLLRSDATSAAAALTAASAGHAGRLLKLAHAAASGRALPPPAITLAFNRHTIDMTSGRVQLKLSRQAYAKLAHFHRVAIPQEGAPAPPPADEAADEAEGAEARPSYERESRAAQASQQPPAAAGDAAADDGRAALHYRLFALLLRYKTIQGHGFQAAIGPPVWSCLRARLDVGVEGFGSPLNAYLPAFGSAFADVDAPFGSRGSFFAMRPTSGSFAANPPFVHNVMGACAEHIDKLLQAAAASAPVGAHALSFAVFLPGWQEGAGFQALSASPFLRRKVLIAAADHGYCDGAAHQRQDPYRFSPYDTAIFVLQTDKASRKWPADDAFEKALRIAFAECTPSESAVKRQSQQTAAAKRAPAPESDAMDTGAAAMEDSGTEGAVRDEAKAAKKKKPKKAPRNEEGHADAGGEPPVGEKKAAKKAKKARE